MVEPTTYEEWWQQVITNVKTHGQRWGQAIMNASPVEWRDKLPDVWEVKNYSNPLLGAWEDKATKELSTQDVEMKHDKVEQDYLIAIDRAEKNNDNDLANSLSVGLQQYRGHYKIN